MKQDISAPIAPVKSAASHLRVYTGLWLTVSVWGTSFVAARFLLHPTSAEQVALSPTLLAALRFTIASLFFVIPLIRALIRRQIKYRDLLLMALLGQIGFSLYFWLQYTGVQKTNASISSILVVGLIPIVTAFLARFFGEERHNWRTFGMLLLGFCGVAIIVFQNQVTVTLRSDFLLGALCLISNAFAFAIYAHLSKRWMQGISPLLMTGGTMTSGALGLVLLTLLDPAHNRWGNVLHMHTVQWLALLFLSLVCSVMAYFLYNYALTQIDASRAAVYIYFEPVFTILLSTILLAERLSWQTILGAAIIAISVALVNLSKRSGRGVLED